MLRGFLAIFNSGAATQAEFQDLCQITQSYPDNRLVFNNGTLIVFARGQAQPIVLQNDLGLVLGELFTAGDIKAPVTKLTADMSDRVIKSGGAWLTNTAWGRYLLLLTSDGGNSLYVLRDPSGGLDCYYWRHKGMIVVTSSLEIALPLGCVPMTFDWQAIASQLVYANPKQIRTGLKGVNELLPGTRAHLTATSDTLSTLWSPWTFAERADQIHTPAEAVALLEQALMSTLGAWSQIPEHALVELSGGLDSSLIAAGLCQGPARLSCLNLKTQTLDADESDYASDVARALALPLSIATLEAAPDLGIVRRSPTFRPALDALQLSTNAQFRAAATALNVDCVFTGAGGDGVFCFLKNAAPATDALLSAGPGRIFFKAIHDLSQLHQCTIWTAGTLAIRKLTRPLKIMATPDLTFLNPSLIGTERPSHPWLPANPEDHLPGKSEHVHTLIAAQKFRDNFSRDDIAPVIAPLLSQPIMEASLRIPCWLWIDKGRNRSCARDAFKNRLPERVLARRSKGNFMIFYADTYHRQKDALLSLLTQGRLVRESIVDAQAVTEFMKRPLELNDSRFLKLFELAKVEAWIKTLETSH
jgi:asparagine synthase (glutamine-hydrolysing)